MFSVGDTVKVVKIHLGNDEFPVGSLGEILEIDHRDQYPILVNIAGWSPVGFAPDELVLVTDSDEIALAAEYAR
jgi:hypothetical protein